MNKEERTGYILLYGSLRTGGIETLIVRMANALVRRGAPVMVICETGALLAALPPEAQTVVYEGGRGLLAQLRSGLVNPQGASSFVLISFDPISAARGLLLETMLPHITAHLSGVFHTRAYFMTGERRDREVLNRLVASAVGFNHLFFMNEECRKAHAEKWRVDLAACPILPLPVDAAKTIWSSQARQSLRIVSVGRLVDFKAYNLGAPDIVRECSKVGVPVTWDIFGTGPLSSEIQGEISRHGMDEAVSLRGELPYAAFGSTVSAYDLFVGVGTAALEAAMVGMPVICGVDSERRLCYGFLKDLPFGNVGEAQEQCPSVPISALIIQYAGSSKSERDELAGECRRVAERYDMDTFLTALSALGRVRCENNLRKKLVGWIYHAVVESRLAGWIRSVKAGQRVDADA